MQGTIVDSKYQILRRLGEGGMGAVYEAQHLGTRRRVAVKLIAPAALMAGGDIIARFEREARASGAIDSQHVVQVLDTGVDPQTNSPYLVMEYLAGEDLQQLVERLGALPVESALRIIAQACAGLSRAHDEGIIHRDIKSANIFIAKREVGEAVVKILDFGIAKVRADPLASSVNRGLTRTGTLLGSPLYMSPEQVLGSRDIDPRSDIFSLGITLYEALCGGTPNDDSESVGALVIAITEGKGRPIQDRAPWVPREVAAIVHKAMQRDPGARFQTAAEMHAALVALLPRGVTLDQSMLVSTSPELRNVASARFTPEPEQARFVTAALTIAEAPLPAPAMDAPAVPASETAFGSTGGGPRPKRTWLIALPAAAVALGVLCAIGFYGTRTKRPESAASSAPVTLASAAPPPSPPSPMAKESAPLAPSESESNNVVDAAVATTPPLPAVPAVPAHVAFTAPRPRSALPADAVDPSAQPPPKRSPPTSGARPSCTPPYTFDGSGKKIWKRECL